MHSALSSEAMEKLEPSDRNRPERLPTTKQNHAGSKVRDHRASASVRKLYLRSLYPRTRYRAAASGGLWARRQPALLPARA